MASEVKFYMDEHVPPAVTRGLRMRGIDVLTTQEARMLGADDAPVSRCAKVFLPSVRIGTRIHGGGT